MKLQEADAKSLLVAQGLPVPDWGVAHTAEEARQAAEGFFSAGAQQVVIKAQVLVGGRGKAGGVKLAGFPDQAQATPMGGRRVRPAGRRATIDTSAGPSRPPTLPKRS